MDAIDDVSLRSLVVLLAVDQSGGFAAAGRQLGLSRTAVSRTVAQLEERVGARLFRRTTRRVVLTDTAQRLVAHLQNLVPDLLTALDQARSEQKGLTGTVRVSMSEAFGRHFVVPSVARFVASHPQVSIHLSMRDQIDDLVQDPIDLAIRMGRLPDSSLIARRLGVVEALLVATPGLHEELAPPDNPRELVSRPAVAFRVPGSGSLAPWAFEWSGTTYSLIPERVTIAADSIEGVVALAKLGCGLAFVPRYLVEHELASGTLVPVFEQARFDGPPVFLCFRERERMPARVRALATHLSVELTEMLKAGPANSGRASTSGGAGATSSH